MSEQKIARTVAEAQVGDLLWVSGVYSSHRVKGYELWPVRKIGRAYFYAGTIDAEHTWDRFHRDSGWGAPNKGYTASLKTAGYAERELAHWQGVADEAASRIKSCRDIETLKTVAFALGIEGPPDFSKIPETSHAR